MDSVSCFPKMFLSLNIFWEPSRLGACLVERGVCHQEICFRHGSQCFNHLSASKNGGLSNLLGELLSA